jgi:hypothetical protein
VSEGFLFLLFILVIVTSCLDSLYFVSVINKYNSLNFLDLYGIIYSCFGFISLTSFILWFCALYRRRAISIAYVVFTSYASWGRQLQTMLLVVRLLVYGLIITYGYFNVSDTLCSLQVLNGYYWCFSLTSMYFFSVVYIYVVYRRWC